MDNENHALASPGAAAGKGGLFNGLSRRLAMTLGAALACLLAVAWLAYHRMVDLAEADQWVRHTYVVSQELDRLLSDLKDAETGQRGFVITGRDLYLEPYDQALAQLDQRLANLKRLTVDNPGQQQRLTEIDRLIRIKLAELKDTIEMRRSAGLNATLAIVNADHGKAVMDLIRQRVAEGQAEEQRLLGQREKERMDGTAHLLHLLTLAGLAAMGLLGLVVYFLQREVGQRRQTERALRWERKHLEDLVEIRTAELAAHKEALEQQVVERTARLTAVNQELQTFTYAASHDLKAPLSRISSFSSLLAKDYGHCLEEDGARYLAQIQRNATRMAALVEDLLAHARIEQHALEIRTVDLRAAVQQAIDERAEEIREKGAEIRLALPQDPVPVKADPHGLAQVLRNILENALKYSARSQPPMVEIGGESRSGCYRLWVRDNGIGFRMDHHDRIFEIFQRLQSYDQYPGSGVGLALVKKAMDRMGGRVWAESQPGQGATFTLEIPR